MTTVRKRPSAAMVVALGGATIALAALVLSLTGIATGLPGKHRIDGNDLKKRVVKASNIRRNAVGLYQLAPGAENAGTGHSIFQNGPAQVPAGSGYTPVLTLDLPAGTYLLLSMAVLGKGGSVTQINCRISAEGDSDRSVAYVNASSNETVANALPHTFPSAGSATLECDNADISTLIVTDGRLTAIPFAHFDNTQAP
jgi:hypothetical protein